MEWRVLEVLDPWGQRREDLRFAQLSRQIAQWLGVKPKGGGELEVKVEDLALAFADGEEREAPPVEYLERALTSWAKAHNARVAKPAPKTTRQAQKGGE